MKLQLHRDSGLSVRDAESKEEIYTDSLENALVDAELAPIAWPDEQLVRIFTLADGRVAVVRDTPAGLRQEAAPAAQQALLAELAQNIEKLRAARLARDLDADASDTV